MMMMMVNIFV